MTDPSLARKKRKITYTASPQGVQKAENALRRLGFGSKSNFAESQFLSRSTVTKFFRYQPIQLDSFKRICDALTLDWKEIAEISEEEQSGRLAINDCSSPNTNEGMEPVRTLRREITVIDESSLTSIAVIVLEGDINSVPNLKIIASVLREYSGETIKIIDSKKGSIKLIVEGSPEDIERLVSRIKSGELKEVSGFPVEDIQNLSESSDDDESIELDDKWRLVQEIVTQAVEGRKLSGADLSDADLRHANLSNANLSNADLSDADLSDANLSRAYLSRADLSNANLIDANLSDANLSNADLSDANLSRANLSRAYLHSANLIGAYLIGANLIDANLSRANLSGANLHSANLRGVNLREAEDVEGALLGSGLGLTESEKVVLKDRGAIFDDSPNDRESVYSPVNR